MTDVKWEWNDVKVERIRDAVDYWILKHEIFHAESVFQTDTGLIESPMLVATILDILEIEVKYE
jgi:hypothetical protein